MERKGGYFGTKVSGSYRPRLPTSPRSPDGSGPTTPLFSRSLSSPISSPGISFRTDDDFFIIELGARYMRVGLGGESHPRCKLDFGPRLQARAGDFGVLLPTTPLKTQSAAGIEEWGSTYELWKKDIRGIDFGLLEDRIERAIRKAVTDHVLVLDDAKRRRIILAIPSSLSHPILSCLLKTLFNNFPAPPSITLVSNAILCTVGAGLRSSLVIDIGWEETIVSAVYEYREVQHKRSTRGMKNLSWDVSRILNYEAQKQSGNADTGKSFEGRNFFNFSETEEAIFRMVWCRNERSAHVTQNISKPSVFIPVPGAKPMIELEIPFPRFAESAEKVFFDSENPDQLHDDHELPLNKLIYHSLLSLPVDIRSICISRLVFTGGGSNIPGLKARLLSELENSIASCRWDPVQNYGSASSIRNPSKTASNHKTPINQAGQVHKPTNKDIDPDSTTPVHLQPPISDDILADMQRSSLGLTEQPEHTPTTTIRTPDPSPTVRAVQTLGAWAGASLMAGLRVKGVVEIERESFLAHGLSGIDRKRESGGIEEHRRQQRQSLLAAPGKALGKAGDKGGGGWSLGVWA